MHKIKDGCPGCGACLGICPVSAIQPGNDKLAVTIDSSCIDCGICKAACPVKLIYVEQSEDIEGGDSGGD